MNSLIQRFKQYYRPLEMQDGPPNPLPLVGAALVIYSLFQYAYIIYPLDPGNVDWEFLVIKNLVDNALTPILGIGLFLFGGAVEMPKWRLSGSRIFTWLSLVLGVIYVLLTPLAVNDALRMSRYMNTRMDIAEKLSYSQRDKVRGLLDKATSMEELEVLTAVLNLSPSMERRQTQMPDDSFIARKEWLWQTIQANQKRMLQEAKDLYVQNRNILRKDVIKTTGGSLFVAAIYFYFFFAFRNVRKKYLPLDENET